MRAIGAAVAFLAFSVLVIDAMAVRTASGRGLMGVTDQIESVAAIYAGVCARCHGAVVEGGDGPALDRRTLASYRSGDRLFVYVRTSMPNDDPGVLSEQEYYDVIAFLLDLGGLNPDGVPIDSSTLPDLVLAN